MRSNAYLVALAGALAMTTSCKEREVSSPDIVVQSPKPNQVIKDKDQVNIEAIFKPKGASITNYSIDVKDEQGKVLFDEEKTCDCKSKDRVEVKTSFTHDVAKNSDVFLDIKAVLDDGREIGTRVPFVLAD